MVDSLDAVRHDAATTKEASSILERHAVVSNLLKNWELPLPWACHVKSHDDLHLQATTDLCALAGMAVLGNYVMPILYGMLGSMAFILRRHGDRLNAQMLSPRDLAANQIRLLLGVVIGGCIGLVFSGSSASQTTGILGAVTTLSAAALAFLAGYGVDATFETLDALIAHVFRVNGTDKPPTQAG
jgi:hypothetical protein